MSSTHSMGLASLLRSYLSLNKKEHLSSGSDLEPLQSTRTLLTDYTELGIDPY